MMVTVPVVAIAVLVGLALFYAGAARAIDGFAQTLERFHPRRIQGVRLVALVVAMCLGLIGALLVFAWLMISVPPPWADNLAVRDVSPVVWGAGFGLAAVGLVLG